MAATAAIGVRERSLDMTDRSGELLTVLAVLLALCLIMVLLRAYVRIFAIKKVAADDWWMFAAMLGYIGYGINNVYGVVNGGTGRHRTELSTAQIHLGLKCWYISEAFYGAVSAMVRMSVALFLLRVSEQRLYKWIIYANVVVIWAISIIFTFVCIFQCDPPNYFFDQVLGLEGKCVDISVVPFMVITHSVVGAICDFIFAFLPIALLWNIKVNTRTKCSIAFLLGLGAISGVALLVRIPYVRVLAISPDFLYETVDVAIWSVLEPSLGIIAGCLATLRPLLKGFGIGRNTTPRPTSYFNEHHYKRKTPTVDRHTASQVRSNDESRDSPIRMDLELESQSYRSRPGSQNRVARCDSCNSDDDGVPMIEPLETPHASVETDVRNLRDPWIEYHTVKAQSQGISVHTSIHTESTYTGS